jgi:hypothetical protein
MGLPGANVSLSVVCVIYDVHDPTLTGSPSENDEVTQVHLIIS